MATVIPIKGEEFTENGLTLERMQKIVGGYIEAVYTKDGRRMYVNEEGLIKGLSLNERATEMVGHPIVGNAIVLTEEESRKDESA